MGGSYVKLSQGTVRYHLNGSESTDLVVLVHGYSSPSFVWEPLVKILNREGLDTLTFDLYGHGFSDRPSVSYDRELFARQIEELIEKVAPRRKLHLVGWSMGAMIVARYATDHPDKVATVSMLSPSGLPIQIGVLGRTALIPVIGDMGHALIGKAALRSAQREFFQDPKKHEKYLLQYDRQVAFSGFQRAMLSTLREMEMDHFHSGYAAFARTQLPIEVVWATNDRATPFENNPVFKQLVPHANIVPLKGAGHAGFYERPDDVAPLLVKFIKTRGH